jgi:hypothetical protein
VEVGGWRVHTGDPVDRQVGGIRGEAKMELTVELRGLDKTRRYGG